MHIEHIALWVSDLARAQHFYTHYFHGQAGHVYENRQKQFRSCFIRFEHGARLELMQRANVVEKSTVWPQEQLGWAHLAFSVGSREAVDALTERLRADGYTIAGAPRTTGDGYYESVVLDPEGNPVEITV
jgi:lactoylglutathione lyase